MEVLEYVQENGTIESDTIGKELVNIINIATSLLQKDGNFNDLHDYENQDELENLLWESIEDLNRVFKDLFPEEKKQCK